jgi:hypothetical protein
MTRRTLRIASGLLALIGLLLTLLVFSLDFSVTAEDFVVDDALAESPSEFSFILNNNSLRSIRVVGLFDC